MSVPTAESANRDPRIPFARGAEVRQRFVDFFAQRGHEVVPSASLVPARDRTLLFTNSGMVQFKDVFRGLEKRPYSRAVDHQRVLRVAGKHNDFEEVGRTPRHLTLFEMLGNWSFGDYFKKEAIDWAWELVTQEFKLPAERIAATVYTDDEESYRHWRDVIGLPEDRVVRWGNVEAGDEKNFWRMADTGPCGPCSELHFDQGAHLSEGPECIPDHSETCPRWVEFWNLVFMEFDQQADGRRLPLPFRSVDTGMGLERMTSILQQVRSVFDTDLFLPIHERAREIFGHDPDAFETERFSYQVIADHSRAVTFLVADGVLPSNEGRGYVLRRILRRAVRHGRLLGRQDPFMADVASTVIDVMAEAYPYLESGRGGILDVIAREEAQFARTLEAGMGHLDRALRAVLRPGDERRRIVGQRAEDLAENAPVLPGSVAFRLHDTYGFPLDLTIELAAEHGVVVDRPGFEEALAEQRARSRTGTKRELAKLAQQQALYQEALRHGETAFLGYETTVSPARVRAIFRDGLEYDRLSGEGEAEIVLDQTPFYPEGGGQIGDQGSIRRAPDDVATAMESGGGWTWAEGVGEPIFVVQDTQRPLPGLIVHRGRLQGTVLVGMTVVAEVNAVRRGATMRNHTATHLLHRALRNTIGDQARQAGSLVAPDYLRFDYPADRALTPEQRARIEAEVRGVVRDDRPVRAELMTMSEAVAQGADAFFDEKYTDTVRTIRVEDYSHELCGGTHCRATGQIGGFLITGERSIGSGMRRIEAVTGETADWLVAERFAALEQVAQSVGAPTTGSVPERVAELQSRVRQLEQRIRSGAAGGPARQRPGELAGTAESVDGARFLAYAAPFESMEDLKSYAKDVRGALGEGVIALALEADEPQLFVTVSEGLVARGVSAGQLVSAGAPVIEGKGGGRPQMAQARGKRRDRIPSALEAIRHALAEFLTANGRDGGGGGEEPPDSGRPGEGA
jgi:alanyl-tRNA synthetase